MFDLERIIGFDWDAGNERKSDEKHDVTRFEAEQVFINQPLLISPDDGHSKIEQRFRALGVTNYGRRLTVIFTLRREQLVIRVISARDMHRKERNQYEEKKT